MTNIQRAQTLNQGQFSRLIKITTATSRYFQRDVLVLMLGHHCGLRVTEVSRITVADVMQPSGKLRVEVSLRESVTKGCRQRCAYLATKPLIAALEAYLGLPYRAQGWHGYVRQNASRFVATPTAYSQQPWCRVVPEHQAPSFRDWGAT